MDWMKRYLLEWDDVLKPCLSTYVCMSLYQKVASFKFCRAIDVTNELVCWICLSDQFQDLSADVAFVHQDGDALQVISSQLQLVDASIFQVSHRCDERALQSTPKHPLIPLQRHAFGGTSSTSCTRCRQSSRNFSAQSHHTVHSSRRLEPYEPLAIRWATPDSLTAALHIFP